MKTWAICLLIFAMNVSAFARCVSDSAKSTADGKSVAESVRSPQEVVETLWKMATEGELLTTQGWDRMADAFAADYPQPSPGSRRTLIAMPKSILITSNGWGILFCRIQGNSAEVVMEYVDVGKIDSKLQYSPGHYPPPMGKSAIVFKLVFAPTHFVTWRAEGNGLKADKIMTGSPAWQLEKTPPLPWTTVNTAIRYVLEMREKTHDPVIRANATMTLAQLLKLH